MAGKRNEVGWRDVAQCVNRLLSEKSKPPCISPLPELPS